jgi:hypothetical protein
MQSSLLRSVVVIAAVEKSDSSTFAARPRFNYSCRIRAPEPMVEVVLTNPGEPPTDARIERCEPVSIPIAILRDRLAAVMRRLSLSPRR